MEKTSSMIVGGRRQTTRVVNGAVVPRVSAGLPVLKQVDLLGEARPVLRGSGGMTAQAVEDTNLAQHLADFENPHRVTASQVGNSDAIWNASELQGRSVSMSSPAAGYVLKWNSASSRWEPSPEAATNIVTVSTDHTISDESIILADATAGDIVLTLPVAADASGRIIIVKKVDNSNDVTLQGDGSETIDGTNSQLMNNQYQCLHVLSDGTEWFII